MVDDRIDPDKILRKINEEMTSLKQGRLKIFFGYAAGVGKTYAMLKAAHFVKEQGKDVIIGYVEPHTRPQTMALLSGLEHIPTLPVKYKGIILNEFDLDAALTRKPQLIIVDELAHSNAEGCRHMKRYQDIEELLKAGIDVYTTVNVQHIESLNDIVASITGVLVRERIPDKVFDSANQVELIDIEPPELIERLNAGQIYREVQAQSALSNFFSVENLISLREIALRRCADRVNKIAEITRIEGTSFNVSEHILVCLSSSPTNAKIIRTAARMASAFKGRLTALYVETPEFLNMNEEDKKSLRNNIALAEHLGATIELAYGDEVVFQISEYARLSGVSKIVVGRNNVKRKYTLGKPSLTEQLSAISPDLEIYIIPDRESSNYKLFKNVKPKFEFLMSDLIKSVSFLIAATAIGFIFDYLGFSETNIITVYILCVLITAVYTSQRVYSLASSIFSVFIFNFFFTDPRLTFNVYDSGYPVTFLIMFFSAFLTGRLADKIKQNARQSARTANRTKILLDTNQLLQQARCQKDIIAITAGQLTKLLGKDIIFYPVENEDLGEPIVFQELTDTLKDCISENEQAVAAWVFKNNKRAGATTNTLGSAKCLYLATRVNEKVYGVAGIVNGDEPLDAFAYSIVLSILGECALALENQKIAKEREKAAILAKNEQLRANLLRAISHDLRTPLTSISGNAGILLSNEDAIDKAKRKVLYSDIYEDSLWLINLVENLLSVTKIEDGSMNLKMTAESMEEIISEALRHINNKKIEHKIIVHQPNDIIIAKMDGHLIVQVIINLIDNAIRYTPKDSEIVISVAKNKGIIVVMVADNGKGISDESKIKIFDMFYTDSNKIADGRRSLGLGLALCKSIVTAHNGTISVRDNTPTGAIFEFTLPAEEVITHE